MHEDGRTYGWQFALEDISGNREYHSLNSLDQTFRLGLRGSVWEAATLVRHVAQITNARVEARFNGTPLAVADPFGA